MSEGKAAADEALRNVLKSGVYSDLIIKCGDYEAAVHKVIICPRSEYFAKACKPGAFKEGREGIIDLKACTDTDEDDISADDPEAVKLMIDFLYTHDYEARAVFISSDEASGTPNKSGSKTKGFLLKSKSPKLSGSLVPSGDCNTVMHTKMYALGSKYGIDSLKAAALGKFAEAVTYAWDSKDFIEALGLVYVTTPDHDKGLRDIAAQAVVQHDKVLLAKPEIEKCICNINGLAYDLLKIKTRENGPSACSVCGVACMMNCGACSKQFVGCSCVQVQNNYYYYCKACRPH